MDKGAEWSNKRINEGVLQWFSHVERMENDMTDENMYVGEFASSCSVGLISRRTA